MISSPLTNILKRIHTEHLRDKQRERSAHFKYTFAYLLIGVSVLYLFGCHTRVYNVLMGPFPLTLEQFLDYLDKYNNVNLDDSPTETSWFSFHHEYLQVELGENHIEQDTQHILSVFSTGSSNRKLLYTFNRIKEYDVLVNLYPNNLYVKLAPVDQNHYSYRFRSFTTRTLRCIVRQLDISPNEYIQWPEKSMYLRTIEEIYAQNATAFNNKVIAQCGILLGYLYRPQNEPTYAFNSNNPVKLKIMDVILDASSPYYPYKTFLLGGLLFSWLLGKACVYLLVYLFYAIYWPSLRIHPALKEQMNVLKIGSLQELNDLLLNVSDEYNYYDRLFLLEDRYLIIMNIDWNEYNTSTLHQFYIREPLTHIPLMDIIEIAGNEIAAQYGGRNEWFPLPTIRSVSDKHGTTWLHQNLMHMNIKYRHYYNERQHLLSEKYRQRREEENKRQLATLTAEEEQHQLLAFNQNQFDFLWNRIIPASPCFIAQFRLMALQEVTDDLPDILCTVCLEGFEYGEYYAQWPCAARHFFH